MNYKRDGLKQFTINTIKQYKESIQVNDWVENASVKESDVDDSFSQIAIHPLIEETIFDLDNDIYPGIFGLERSIVLGEIDFLIKELLKKKTNNNTSSIAIAEINPIYLKNQIGDWNASIILPVDILYRDWLKNPTWLKDFNLFADKIKFKTDGKEIPMYAIPQKLINEIKNLVIIFHLDHTKWIFAKYKNKLLKKYERLDIKIGNITDNRRDVLIRTVNKLEANQDYLKFIELTERN